MLLEACNVELVAQTLHGLQTSDAIKMTARMKVNADQLTQRMRDVDQSLMSIKRNMAERAQGTHDWETSGLKSFPSEFKFHRGSYSHSHTCTSSKTLDSLAVREEDDLDRTMRYDPGEFDLLLSMAMMKMPPMRLEPTAELP